MPPLTLRRGVAYPNPGLVGPSSPPFLNFYPNSCHSFSFYEIFVVSSSRQDVVCLSASGSSSWFLYIEDGSLCWYISSYPLRFSSVIHSLQEAFVDLSLLCFANALCTNSHFSVYIQWHMYNFLWNCELYSGGEGIINLHILSP